MQNITHIAHLMLGTNLGNRENNLTEAKKLIELECGKLLEESDIYETAAWGLTQQPNFLNAALQIETTLTPQQLITKLLKIEEKLGRKRTIKMGPRIIDIDILLMDNMIVNEPNLTIPHPKMQERRFVLLPLNQIASQNIHPVYNKTITELLNLCTDELDVKKFYNTNTL